MINRWLFTHIDNSPLIVFRIIFGLLIALEAIGAIFTGWIKRTLVTPDFTFNFIGFDFLQPLPGNGMYYYYAIMGIFGLLVMIGYRYKLSMSAYTLMWAGVYFMQKSSYNNHYYLLLLLCCIMICLPAADYYSLDTKQHPDKKKLSMPRWCLLLIIGQMWIVYTYGSVAKWYPDWLDFTVPKNLMAAKAHYPIIGKVLQNHWAHVSIAYTGILYDLLIIPLLLWRRTRWLAFGASIFFHLFNSIVFQVGIFPYLSLAFSLFFFPREVINRRFLKEKPFYTKNELIIPKFSTIIIPVFFIYLLVQIALPLRHWIIPGDVLWTEEGHRMSWRMMLRSRAGITNFYIKEKDKDERVFINKSDYLSNKQIRTVSTKPDAMWQFAQRLKKEYHQQGKEIEVYIDSKVSINGKKRRLFIDPEVDIANVPWNYFSTNPWIIKYPKKTKENSLPHQ